MPVANIGARTASLQNATAINAMAMICIIPPTAAHRAPRIHGGTGKLASGIAVTT